MYNTDIIAERIKERAKVCGIPLKKILETVGLGRNFIASSLTSGSMPKADNLAKLADYFGVSVDYLLGRTDNPKINQ